MTESTPGGSRDTAHVIAPPPLIYASGLLIGLLLGVPLRPPGLPSALATPLGLVLLIAGMGLAGWFLVAFIRAGTAVDPGRPSTQLVTSGPYRLTRNPGYLGMALVYVGVAILVGGSWAFLTLVPTLAVIDRLVIAREERYLERQFGEEYVSFKARTRRWL